MKKMPKQPFRNPILSNIFIWLLVFIVAWAVWNFLVLRHGGKVEPINYSQFLTELNNDNIKSVVFTDKEISGSLKQESYKTSDKNRIPYKEFKTTQPSFDDPEMVSKLKQNNVSIIGKHSSPWSSILISAIPWVLFIGIWIFFIRRMSQGSDRAFSFGKSKARLLATDRPKTTFEDVAGVDEAKDELKEVIEFLKSPQKFQKLGGKIPKGVLLVGPTGTGKTLLARAVAGEAGVPFLSISGSDFVEMFVGVGAARVRDLFEQGKRNAPCIIFIDEIDAVGRQRGAGLGGGHDEREQTLNQLLVEMDGFDTQEGVIIMAATNRPDILDYALLRPGRFDRQIVVDRPDVVGREGILKVHTKKIPLGIDVDVKILARGTSGFTGADLANMVNEAALLAARRNKATVEMQDFEDAKDKVLMGVERKSLLISDNEKKWIAFHEAGHTLVSRLIPGTDPIHKVTIIPRGQALGVTQQLPIDDRKIYPKSYCVNQLTIMLGGRVAEELEFNDISTGARDDINRATILARKMACEWGMSEKLGPLSLGKQDEEIFLGREMGLHRNFSEETAKLIDSEIRRFVEEAHREAHRLLQDNVKKLKALAQKLLEKEILDTAEIDEIIKESI